VPVTFEVEDHDGLSVGVVTISRPERRNAIDHTALDELHDCVRQAASADLRSMVLTGAENQFCSGADLKELEDLTFTRALRRALDDLAGLPFPTVAAISGACMGLGLQLAVSCDLRLATPDARFAVPVAKLGLMVDHWTVQRLALGVGHSTARWMMLTAQQVTAERAHELGFVHQLVEAGPDGAGNAVLSDARLLAGQVAKLAPLALSGSKLGLDLLEVAPDDVATAGGEAAEPRSYRQAFERAWGSGDLVEGRAAFAERRAPVFRGE
jgi:enoyl-CoA hydratase